jgi:catechol 2,3-dioxygenase-like lactoylglutathione lyase family enzyme
MSFEIAGIDHLVLRTANMEAMLAFYGDVLGCKLERDARAEFGLAQLRAGTGLIDLVDVDSKLGAMGGGPPTATANNMDHFCLQVDVICEEDILKRLDEHGIEHKGFEKRYGAQGFGNSVYLQDPDGNTVELRERL